MTILSTRCGPPSRSHAGGFSLLELMIVAAIVAILAAIAMPSYRSYVIRTHRTVAKSLLVEIANRQESYFTQNKGYSSSIKSLGYAGDILYINDAGQNSGSSATDTIYTVTLASTVSTADCSGASGSGSSYKYALLATPTAPFVDASCGTLCVTQTGERGSSVPNSLKTCWGR